MFAIGSLILTLYKKYNALWFTGAVCFALVVYTYNRLESEFALLSLSTNMLWGWYVLTVGALVIIASAALHKFRGYHGEKQG